MISKVCSGHSFYGSIRYICQVAKHAEILTSEGVRTHDPKLMIQDFQRQNAFRPEKKQACFHGILSFYPGEKPSDNMISEIAIKYLTGLGFINTQYAVVKHSDRAHLHVHLVANLVDNDGKSIADKWIGLRGKKLAQQLTFQFGLTMGIGKSLPKTDLENLRAPEQYQYRIYAAVKSELRKSDSIEDLRNRLTRLGIDMEFKYKGKTKEKQGVSFRLGEYCFKGSQIDRQFSYGNLMKAFPDNISLKNEKPTMSKDRLVTESPILPLSAIRYSHSPSFEKGLLDVLNALFQAEKLYEQNLPHELRQSPKPKRKRRPRL